MKWRDTNYVEINLLDLRFLGKKNVVTNHLVIASDQMRVMLKASTSYFPGSIVGARSFAIRKKGMGYERAHGTFDEGLELVKQIAMEPGADLEEIVTSLSRVMGPVELMAFISSIDRMKNAGAKIGEQPC